MSNFHGTRRGGAVIAEAWVKVGGLARSSEIMRCSFQVGIGCCSITSRTTVIKMASWKGRYIATRARVLNRTFSSGG